LIRDETLTLTPSRLLLRVQEAADRLAISKTAFEGLRRAGAIQVVHIGRSVRVPVSALDEYVERLQRQGHDALQAR
jgi:excisionase family DNA binding protein